MTVKKLHIGAIIWVFVAIAIGFKPLVDPDLGWHLVGGLYALENSAVPILDIIGSQKVNWVSYSWAAEILFSFVYKLFGFKGLVVLQGLVVSSMFLTLIFLIHHVCGAREKTCRDCDSNYEDVSEFAPLLSFIASIVLVLPVAYLRPQAFSVIFFIFLLFLLERNRIIRGFLPFISLAALSCLWANVHVYWILVPITVALFGVFEVVLLRNEKFSNLLIVCAKVLVLFLCGFVSPYGVDNIVTVFKYAFCHDVGYSLITEFQPMSLSIGVSCVWYWIVLGVTSLFIKSAIKKAGVAQSALWILLGVGSYFRVKFLPLFGVITAVVWAKAVSQCLLLSICKRINKSEVCSASPALSKKVASVLVGVFVGLYIGLWPIEPVVPYKWTEIFTATEIIRNNFPVDDNVDYSINVLNEFTNGGWASFGFWNLRKFKESVSPYKVAIDGRTLVVGEDRLANYRSIMSQQSGWCDVVALWNVSVALLSIDSAVQKGLIETCGGWREIWRGKKWIILARNKP